MAKISTTSEQYGSSSSLRLGEKKRTPLLQPYCRPAAGILIVSLFIRDRIFHKYACSSREHLFSPRRMLLQPCYWPVVEILVILSVILIGYPINIHAYMTGG